MLIDVVDTMGRFGRLQLMQNPAHGLVLNALDRAVLEEVLRQKKIAPMLGTRIDDDTVVVHPSERGRLKQALLKVGWPAEDLAGYVDGEARAIELAEDGWSLRTYQKEAVEGFLAGGCGLIVCGEVRLLRAPIFRRTADLQSRRRRGLTATLVREDGREGDVFSLIGPKRYDAPWKDIEAQGWIAPGDCTEVRVTLTDAERMAYATAEDAERYRLCATARTKHAVVRTPVDRHPDEQVLVIGAYLDQLDQLGETLGAPVIQGSTTNKERERLYDAVRAGASRVLVVSKVANFSIDL